MTRHRLKVVGLRATCDQCDFQGAIIFPPFGFVGSQEQAIWRVETDHNIQVIQDRLVEYPGKIPAQIDPHFLVDPLHEPLPLETKP